jgi:hypothetical protein
MQKVLSIRWFQYYIPITLLLFSILTIERVISPEDGGSDRLYGLPFSYVTGNVGCTGCYEVYVIPLFFDLLAYLSFVLLIFKAIERLGLKLKTHWIPGLIGVMITGLLVFFFLGLPDAHFYKLTNDGRYKTISQKLTWQH